MTKRAALYARVSSAEQARPDATSIGEQLKRGAAYAEAQGWDVVATFKDEGVSGASRLADRPEGGALLDAARDFDVVIVWSMDRFTRSATKGLADLETLEDGLGLAVVFVKEAIDTSTPSGRLFRSVLASFAEFERETIRDRMMTGRAAKAGKGEWASGRLPYGYRFAEDGITIEVVPEEADIILFIFMRRALGLSMRAIAEELNKSGKRPRAHLDRKTGDLMAPTFSAGSIGTYLANRAYHGKAIVRNLSATKGAPATKYVYDVPPIVSKAEWEDAQKVTSGRPARTTSKSPGLYPMTGYLFHVHGAHGARAPMTGERRRGRRVYRCTAASRPVPGSVTCSGLGATRNGQVATSIDADLVERSLYALAVDRDLINPANTLGIYADLKRFLREEDAEVLVGIYETATVVLKGRLPLKKLRLDLNTPKE